MVNLFYDSNLLFQLYMKKFKKETLGFKIKMLPKLIKKYVALVYYKMRMLAVI